MTGQHAGDGVTGRSRTCVCDGRPACQHPVPCPEPSTETHGPWCAGCNEVRFARITANLDAILAATKNASTTTPGDRP